MTESKGTIEASGLPAFFLRHCEWLTLLLYKEEANRRFFKGGDVVSLTYSAFVIAMEEGWVLVTAGHILKDIETALAEGLAVQSYWLCDHGPHHDIPICVDYARATKVHIYQEGADYGLIALDYMYVENLLKNDVIPLPRACWGDSGEYEAFGIVGSPPQWNQATELQDSVRLDTAPVFLRCDRGEMPQDLEKPFPRIALKLVSGAMNENGDILSDMDGLSGGPVFGFRRNQEGRLKY